MIKNPDDIIKAGDVAYHVAAGKIDDIMFMNKGSGYNGEPVSNLIRDGWTFMCDKKDFKKGQNVSKKKILICPSRPYVEQKPEIDMITCPHCKGKIKTIIASVIVHTKIEKA